MEPTKSQSLEHYVERHRADFDLHEPRPELWAVLEKKLHGNAAAEAAPHAPVMSVSTDEPVAAPALAPASGGWPGAAPQRTWLNRYGIAAGLAALVLAAGAAEAWKSKGERPVPVAAAPAGAAVPSYWGPSAQALAASETTQLADARLDTAVQGMESYYVSQLRERQAELSRLAPDARADWARELTALDSSYRLLKRELPHHPQPEVVLTAMNRNLQIRLDILDQQLEVRTPVRLRDDMATGPTPNAFVLADSRRRP